MVIKFYRKDAQTNQILLVGTEIIDVSALILNERGNNTVMITEEAQVELMKTDAFWENHYTVDMHKIKGMKNYTGEIKLLFSYQPRLTTQADQVAQFKQDIFNRNKEEKFSRKKDNKHDKKDALALNAGPISASAAQGTICFLSVDHMRLEHTSARRCLGLRHVMLELSYGKQKM
jgi:hypothetical protein